MEGHDDTVRRSKNAALIGASGIVVQETENTFKVVTRKDKLKGAHVLSVYVHLLNPETPPLAFLFLQYCQSRGPSLPLPFPSTVQSHQALVLLRRRRRQVLEQIQGRTASVTVMMAKMIHEKQGQCWMTHT